MEPPLIEAIRTGDLEKVGSNLNVDTVNVPNADGNTPLLIACALGNPKIVTMLIEKGANLNAQTSTGFTPLMLATIKQSKEIVEILCTAGAPINATKDKETGVTALMIASGRYLPDVQANLQIVETLIRKGANVNIQSTEGYTALMDAASLANNPEIVKMLLDNGADRSITTKYGQTAYSLVSNPNGNPDWVESLRPSPRGGRRSRRRARRSKKSRSRPRQRHRRYKRRTQRGGETEMLHPEL